MTNLRVTRLVNGPFKQNCYVLAKDQLAVLIDPGSDPAMIQSALEAEDVKPIAIINTHGHFDHIGAVVDLVKTYKMPFYLHEADLGLVKSANIYRLLFKTKTPISIPQVDKPLTSESTELMLENFKFTIIHTPGHTPGSVCFHIENLLFTGDTLMGAGPGTTKLPGGDAQALKYSISLLREIDPSVTVFPGHGRELPLYEIWDKCDGL